MCQRMRAECMSPNCRARLRPGSPACTTCSRPGTTSTGLEAAWPQVKCHRGRLGGWMPIANDALWAAATDGDDAGDASTSLIRAGGAHLLCSHLPWLRLPHLQARRGPGTGSRVRIPSPPPPTSSTQHTTSLTLPARPRPSTAWRPPGTSTSSRPALSACGPGRAGSAPSSCRSCASASVSGRALIWLGSPSARSRVVSYGSTLAWIVPYRLLHVLQVCRASQPHVQSTYFTSIFALPPLICLCSLQNHRPFEGRCKGIGVRLAGPARLLAGVQLQRQL